MREQCDKINLRLKDKPGKTMTYRLYRKLYKPGVATRMYRKRRVYFCTECGCEIGVPTAKECPQCHTRWTNDTIDDLKGNLYMHEAKDAIVFEAKGDLQMTRYYRVERHVRFGQPVSIFAWETERFYYAPDGQRIMYQRAVNGLSGYWDSFSRYGGLYYRRELSPRSMSYGALNRANMSVCYWEVRSLTKQWSYKNVAKLLEDHNGDTSVIRLIAYPYAETMLKCGQEKLFNYLVKNGDRLPKRAEKTVNICIRHKYTINDPSMWLDTIYLMVRFDLDLHNPKFVCAENLKALHDKLYKRKERIEEEKRAKERAEWERRAAEQRALWDAEEKKRQAEKARRVAEFAQSWAQHFGKLLSIDIKSTNIEIRPLQSIDEFKEEAAHMHHCVYQCEYYDYYRHPNSLILSAKDDNGKRLATIEYNLRTNEVMQCRAACNAVPPRKDEIEKLIADYRPQFVEYEKTIKSTEKKETAVAA